MHILFQAFKDEDVEESVDENEDIVLDASGESCVTEPAHDSSTQCSQPDSHDSSTQCSQSEPPIAIDTPAILASHSVLNTCLLQICNYYIFINNNFIK